MKQRLPKHLRILPPRELCAHCREWLSIEDIESTNDDDFPHCVLEYDFNCVFYMNGSCDTCPRFNEI